VSNWPDVEGELRSYLRADAGVAALVGARVFFGVPKRAAEATFPLVVVRRVGGGQDGSDAPVDVALMQIDCWGSIANGNGLKAGATALVNAVRSSLEAVGTDSTAVLKGANVETVLWLPEADNDRPRYSVTAVVTAISP
jgi:hypothetical protein